MFSYSELPLKRVRLPTEIPPEDHWAILLFKTNVEHVPADQRSKDCPGHGYPAHTVTHESYEYWAAMTEEDLKQALLYLEAQRKKNSYTPVPPYAVISVRKCSIKTEIRIEVG